jgi:HK97 family phage major capsid protein
MKGFESQVKPAVAVPAIDEAELIRSLARGEIRSHSFEKRDVTKGSTGAPIPTSFYDSVLLLARHIGPMLETSTVLNTAGGENLQIPSLSAYSTGTVTSEAASFGESDPTFNAFKTLGAYKYGFLTQVSREMVEDSGVDILGFLATQTGNALGFAVNGALTTGTGTVQPTGIVTASAAGVTGGTGVSGAFTADNLIDLVYSVDTAGRTLPGTGFQMNSKSIAAVRKLKDTAGQYIFQPSLSADARDLLLGYPIYENPAMVDPATSAKSVIFGHLPSYYVRQVGGLRLDRSDDYAFQNDLITFRASFRVDGNLIQTSHVKHFVGGAS